MEENKKPEIKPQNTGRMGLYFVLAFSYYTGFQNVTREHDTSTGFSLFSTIIGWLCIGLSVTFSVLLLIRFYKEQFNKK